ncbi:shikimate dehydrogenase [Mesorhizobium sp. CAU 1732]|uniref:shikimate dehydrogenase n=1 Tax=Mesorhizobium sp. CAU 1732 TaxID=3140358 RepID=UPI00326175AE
MAEAARKAFIIGHPISHSRSPMIHGHWLEKYDLAGSYERIDVAPSDLTAFVRGMRDNGFVGGNVTIPHKEAVCGLVDHVDEAAQLIGAANTLWFEDGRLNGSNSDAPGFAADLDNRAAGWRQARAALVLGAGGASRAVLFALIQAGIPEIRLVNRSPKRARELADRFGSGVRAELWDARNELASGAQLVVNTTSIGLNGEGGSPLDVANLPDDAIVNDIVYTPLLTPLLAAARARGLKTVDGLGMLLEQAVPGFERWFGVRPQVTEALRALVVADIEAHR